MEVLIEKDYERIIGGLFSAADDTSQSAIDVLQLTCRQHHIYIMPCGLGGEDILYRLKQLGIKVFAFCDNDPNKAGTMVLGIPVRTYPEMLADPQKLVLITSGTYYGELRKQLDADAVDCLDATSYLNILGESTTQAKHYITSHIPEILRTWELFADEKSKEIFIAALMSRLTRGPATMASYNSASEGCEYVLPESMPAGSRQVIFDCGAFTGDSAVHFRQYFGEQCHVVCFEPDAENYRKLLQNCQQDYFTCVNAGVGERPGEMGFSQTGTAGAHFSPNAEVQSRIYSIDSYCKESGIRPTLIKLDVEGFEMQALQGAAQTIRACQPTLAVCVYHKVSDYVDVPTYLKSLNPDFRLYLRHFSDRYTDTVCFAVPHRLEAPQ